MNNQANNTSVEKNRVEDGTLYLVATPVGNLADISERCLKVLSSVSFVAAEDTRNSGLLLSRLGIRRPLVSYHEHNKAERGEEIVARLAAGESCALITDAGTPAVSDPGEDLVVLCAERGIPVTAIPGACAGILALTLSALPTARFCFEGFLPVSGRERRDRISLLAAEERTVILHEAPHRLSRTLTELADVCGPTRRIAVCRELTKLNEEVQRVTLGDAAAYYRDNEPRGEFVLVLEGASASVAECGSGLTVEEHITRYTDAGLSEKDAIKAVAHDRGVPKNTIYTEVLRYRGKLPNGK